MFTSLQSRLRGLVSLFWREVAKFGTVGAMAFVIDNGLTLFLMHGPMSGSEVKARFVGAVTATLFSWVANRYWTFRRRRNQNKVARELGLFVLINGVGILISTGFTWVARYPMGIQDKNLLFLAGVLGICVATVLRFFAYRFWVFNAELDQEPGFEQDYELLEEPAAQRPARGARAVGVPRTEDGPAPGSEAGTGHRGTVDAGVVNTGALNTGALNNASAESPAPENTRTGNPVRPPNA